MNNKMIVMVNKGDSAHNVRMVEKWVKHNGAYMFIAMDLVNNKVYINGEETEDTKSSN